MKERRRFRRSSPDAPQGFVPVLSVFAGLLAVVAVTALSFSHGGSGSHSDSGHLDAGRSRHEVHGSTTTAPGTTLIFGTTTTLLFVTTTTPITTTTTTTTTTLPGPDLSADAGVTFAPGQTTATFTVHSANPAGVAFTVTGVPDGMSASPTGGTATPDSPVTVTLTITDPDVAASGTITLVGDDGSRVEIPVTVQAESLSITGVRSNPDPPVCDQASQLVATVEGSDIASVQASVRTPGGTVSLTMQGSGSGPWSAGLPAEPAGTHLAGTVTARTSSGQSATKGFSITVAGGGGCKPSGG